MYDFGNIIRQLEYVQRTCRNHMANNTNKLIAHKIMIDVGNHLSEIGQSGFNNILEVMTRPVVKEVLRLRGKEEQADIA